jgi:alkylresorcinol/alkylpyrone synthase
METNGLPTLTGVATAMPSNYQNQQQLAAALKQIWAGQDRSLRLFDQIQRSLKIKGRHVALPVDDYYGLDTFSKCNNAWLRVAPELGTAAVRNALERAGVEPREVGHLFFVTVTGIATPSIDTRVVAALGLRRDVKRTPIFGLGCTAGASGIARAADYVRAYPNDVAVLLSVELCSLTLQRTDTSPANIIASGLFGDGAAAVVVSGSERNSTGPKILASKPLLFANTEEILGWDLVDTGFKIVLSPKLTDLVREHIREEVDSFLADNGVARDSIRHWLAHAGGPNILKAMDRALALPEGALTRSWNSLRCAGNLSSASVLYTINDLVESGDARAGDLGLVIGMGPGFSMELVLLQW